MTQSSSLHPLTSLFSTIPVIQKEGNEEKRLCVEKGGLGRQLQPKIFVLLRQEPHRVAQAVLELETWPPPKC